MLGKLKHRSPVKIIGAGFAGLSLAYRLKKLEVPFTIYEKEKIGGKIQTLETVFGPVESAASTLYLDRHAVAFIRELSLPTIHSPKKLKRLIWKESGPASPFSLPLLFQVILKLHQTPPPLTSLEEVFLPLLGKKYVDEILSPAFQGIYGAEAAKLHLPGLYPNLEGKSFRTYWSFLKALRNIVKKEQDTEQKGSVTFPGGMQMLIERMRSEVAENIIISQESFTLEDNLAICTNSCEAATILSKLAPDISDQLSRIQYVPVSSFTFFTAEPLPELQKALGMLIPQKYGNPVLGIINQSELSPQNYPGAYCYRAICQGEHSDPARVMDELKKILPDLKEQGIVASYLTPWKQGLPLYDKERSEAVHEIGKLLKNREGLLLFGNYSGGISLRSLIAQSQSFSFV